MPHDTSTRPQGVFYIFCQKKKRQYGGGERDNTIICYLLICYRQLIESRILQHIMLLLSKGFVDPRFVLDPGVLDQNLGIGEPLKV